MDPAVRKIPPCAVVKLQAEDSRKAVGGKAARTVRRSAAGEIVSNQSSTLQNALRKLADSGSRRLLTVPI